MAKTTQKIVGFISKKDAPRIKESYFLVQKRIKTRGSTRTSWFKLPISRFWRK